MDARLAKLMTAMVAYDRGDARRVQHFVKVHDFAATIGRLEGLGDEELFTLEAAAILHDVGIHAAERKYGNSSGKHQEELGPAEARKVIRAAGVLSEEQTERVCWLIAHHHTYTDVTAADHRILLEADFLVNGYEDGLSTEAIVHFRDLVFRSPSAIDMLNDMFLKG